MLPHLVITPSPLNICKGGNAVWYCICLSNESAWYCYCLHPQLLPCMDQLWFDSRVNHPYLLDQPSLILLAKGCPPLPPVPPSVCQDAPLILGIGWHHLHYAGMDVLLLVVPFSVNSHCHLQGRLLSSGVTASSSGSKGAPPPFPSGGSNCTWPMLHPPGPPAAECQHLAPSPEC